MSLTLVDFFTYFSIKKNKVSNCIYSYPRKKVTAATLPSRGADLFVDTILTKEV